MTFSVGLRPTKSWQKSPRNGRSLQASRLSPATKSKTICGISLSKKSGASGRKPRFFALAPDRYRASVCEAQKEWVDAHMSKPYREIWEELRGGFVYPLNIGEKHDYQSISKTKTFTPPSTDNREFVFSQLSKNVENACIKARRHGLAPKKIFFFLKTQEFRFAGIDLSLQARVSAPHEILRLVRNHFDKVYRPKASLPRDGCHLGRFGARRCSAARPLWLSRRPSKSGSPCMPRSICSTTSLASIRSTWARALPR
jgi:hypothetical protein